MRLIAAGLLAILTVGAGATHAQARPYGHIAIKRE